MLIDLTAAVVVVDLWAIGKIDEITGRLSAATVTPLNAMTNPFRLKYLLHQSSANTVE